MKPACETLSPVVLFHFGFFQGTAGIGLRLWEFQVSGNSYGILAFWVVLALVLISLRYSVLSPYFQSIVSVAKFCVIL